MSRARRRRFTLAVGVCAFVCGLLLSHDRAWAEAPTCSADAYKGQTFQGRTITSGFGTRDAPVDPRTGATGSTFHRAVDLNVSANPNLGAFHGGTVVYSGPRGGWGNTMIVRNGNFEVQYGHAGSLNYGVGETVRAGDAVGNWSSCSGTCSGPHADVIYRVNSNGNWVNVDPVKAEELIAQGIEPGSDEFTRRAIEETAEGCSTDPSALQTQNPTRPGGPTEQDLRCDPRVRTNIDAMVKASVAMRTDIYANVHRPPMSVAQTMKVPCKSNELQRIATTFSYAPSSLGTSVLGQISGAAGPVSGLLNSMFAADVRSFNTMMSSAGGLSTGLATFVQGQLSGLLSNMGLGDSPFASALCGLMADALLMYVQCEAPIAMPTLGTLTGPLNSMLPENCAGAAVRGALYAASNEAAFRPMSQSITGQPGGLFGGTTPLRLGPASTGQP